MKFGILTAGLIFNLVAMASDLQVSLEPRADQLKKQILRISSENTSNLIDREFVRLQLEPLIQELSELAGPVKENNWRDFAPGSWQQIWSDEPYFGLIGFPRINYERVYLYISIEDWGYKLSERLLVKDQAITFAMAFQGRFIADLYSIEVSQILSRILPFEKDESISELAHKIKTGAESGFQVVDMTPYPQNPIGTKYDFQVKYIDADMLLGYEFDTMAGKKYLVVYRRRTSIE